MGHKSDLIWSIVVASGLRRRNLKFFNFEHFCIVSDPVATNRFDPLVLRKNVLPLCMLYRVYYGECSEKLVNHILAADFRHRFPWRKYHQNYFDDWHSASVRFMLSFCHTWWGLKRLNISGIANELRQRVFKKRAHSS
ncbi:hypothetical protein EVAR_50047_1 [Eumeta japonica]|uniref:Uncharacterized protein n=1 Tax=Eumeta variegata TaxID=151549 RepID=A0A4C1XGL9_EUMVA|nr:hypothetical protein EVAR_50047_1 [Eumeta japonica]